MMLHLNIKMITLFCILFSYGIHAGDDVYKDNFDKY